MVKSLPASAGDSIVLQYSCPKNSMDRGAWWAKAHRIAKESDVTQRSALIERSTWRSKGPEVVAGTRKAPSVKWLSAFSRRRPACRTAAADHTVTPRKPLTGRFVESPGNTWGERVHSDPTINLVGALQMKG